MMTSLPELTDQLSHTDSCVRCDAIRAIARYSNDIESVLEGLVEDLLSGRPDKAKKAKRIVCKLIPAARDMISIVDHLNPEVAKKQATILLRQQFPTSEDRAKLLIEKLADDSETVIETTIESLGLIGNGAGDAIAPLAAMTSDDRFRQAALAALAKIGVGRLPHLAPLVRLVGSKDSHVRQTAAHAIASIRKEKFWKPIAAYSTERCHPIAAILDQIEPAIFAVVRPALSMLANDDPLDREAALALFQFLSPDAGAAAATILAAEGTPRNSAAVRAARTKLSKLAPVQPKKKSGAAQSRSKAEAQRRELKAIAERCGAISAIAPNWLVNGRKLNPKGDDESPFGSADQWIDAALPKVFRAAADRDPKTICMAIRCFEILLATAWADEGSDAEWDAALRGAMTHPHLAHVLNHYVCPPCEYDLVIPAHDQVLECLGSLLTHQDVGVRRTAIVAIAASGFLARFCVPCIAAATLDTDKIVRRSAFATLQNLGAFAPEAVPQLEECLGSRDQVTRCMVIDMLATFGKGAESAVDRLLGILKDGRDEEQYRAAIALAQIAPIRSEGTNILLDLLQTGRPQHRFEAAIALSWSAPRTDGLLKIIAPALADSEKSRRLKAIVAIGRLGPRAAAAAPQLAAMITDSDDVIQPFAAVALMKMGRAAAPGVSGLAKLKYGSSPSIDYLATCVRAATGFWTNSDVAHFHEVFKNSSDLVELNNAAHVLGSMGDLAAEATPALLDAIADPWRRFWAVRALGQIPSARTAISDWIQAQQKQKDHCREHVACALVARGISYSAGKQNKKAIADLTAALKLDPKNAEAYYRRAVAYRDNGDFPSAFDDVQRLLKIESSHGEGLAIRGEAYRREGDVRRALADLNKAIAIAPSGTAYCNRAIIHHEAGRLVEAIDDYSKVIECEPLEADHYRRRARAYEQAGDAVRASADIDEALAVESYSGA